MDKEEQKRPLSHADRVKPKTRSTAPTNAELSVGQTTFEENQVAISYDKKVRKHFRDLYNLVKDDKQCFATEALLLKSQNGTADLGSEMSWLLLLGGDAAKYDARHGGRAAEKIVLLLSDELSGTNSARPNPKRIVVVANEKTHGR